MTSDDAPVQETAYSAEGQDLRLFMVAGEPSGDLLGAKLMVALNERRRGRVRYVGVGGQYMAQQGLVSQFPMEEVAVMGAGAILSRLPTILRRIQATAAAAVASEPDALIVIDSPEFTHPIARRVRRRAPEIPIIDYVSPSVWAWRPGRARRMRNYVDHVLALLPFEPEAHLQLRGPPCTYVGHPLIELLPWIRALDTRPLAQRFGLPADTALLVVLPGSRPFEVKRIIPKF
jgi:lipid-A-disaccharide synthase